MSKTPLCFGHCTSARWKRGRALVQTRPHLAMLSFRTLICTTWKEKTRGGCTGGLVWPWPNFGHASALSSPKFLTPHTVSRAYQGRKVNLCREDSSILVKLSNTLITWFDVTWFPLEGLLQMSRRIKPWNHTWVSTTPHGAGVPFEINYGHVNSDA